MIKLKTHQALLLSFVSLLLCGAMLIGTTYAWFVDSAVNTGNRIKAGYLNIDLLMDKAEDGTYESIKNGQGDIFDEQGNGANWEPGVTKVVYLAVQNNANVSTLAFRYSFILEVEGELSKVLEYAIIPAESYENGLLEAAAQQDQMDAWDYVMNTPGVSTGDLREGTVVARQGAQILVGETDYFALAVHMDKAAGDAYQGEDVTIDVTVRGTQVPAESDAFGTDYDKDASDVYLVSEADDLRNNMQKGGIFVLTNDVSLDGCTPVSANNYKYPSIVVFDQENLEAVIDLNGYTLSYDGRAETAQLGSLIRATKGMKLTIKNGTIEYAQAAFGTYLVWAQGEGTDVTIENCDFKCTGAVNASPSQNGTMFYATTNAKITIESGTYNGGGYSYLMNVSNSDDATIHAKGGDFYGQDLSLGDNLQLRDVTNPADNHIADGSYFYSIGDGWYRVGTAEQVSADMGTDAWVAVNGKVFTSFADVAANMNADWNGVVRLDVHGNVAYNGEKLDVPSTGANATGKEIKTILINGLNGHQVTASQEGWQVADGVVVSDDTIQWVIA